MLKKARADAAREEAAGKGSASDGQAKDLAESVLESSRQIWLAGLGAFARAKGEGAKVFESLVQHGQSLEARTREAAAGTAAAAREVAQAKAREMQAKAGGTWDKLEQVFEDRVARALSRLGVHTQKDVERLSARVDALADAVNALVKSNGAMPGKRALLRKRGGQSAGGPESKSAPAGSSATTSSGRTKRAMGVAGNAAPKARKVRKPAS